MRRACIPLVCASLALACSTGGSGDDGFTDFGSFDAGEADASTDDDVGTDGMETGDSGTTTGDGDTGTDDTTTTGTDTGTDTGGPECGNGMVEEGEECDEGPANDDMGTCKSDCTAAYCGDGLVSPREACDDGNDVDDDDCSNDCTPATCGNGIVEGSEQCDDGNEIISDECLDDCTLAYCGDGYIWVGMEDCDDGGESLECDADCTAPACGDGTVNMVAGEECDDGNDVDTDDCPSTCLAATCGDGFLQEGVEDCDTDQFGAETCETQGFTYGDLSCDDQCIIGTADCDNSPCPGGGAFVNDYCWYASEVCETTATKCQSVGLTGNDGYVNTVWDMATMQAIADQLGLIAGGDAGCCVQFGWIENGTIYTHNFGDQFYNWGNCYSNNPTLKACNPP